MMRASLSGFLGTPALFVLPSWASPVTVSKTVSVRNAGRKSTRECTSSSSPPAFHTVCTEPVATENQYLHYFRSLLLFARSIFFFGIQPHSNRTCQPTIVAEKSPNEYCIGANALFHFSECMSVYSP